MLDPSTLCRYEDVTFQLERLADCLDELKELHELHYEEQGDKRYPLAYNYETALRRNSDGSLLVFTARKDGEMVGHCCVWLFESMHTGQVMAKDDTLFVKKEHRKGRIAIKFFQYCEAVLRAAGVAEVLITLNVANPVWKVWKRLGYRIKCYQMSKEFE